MRLGGRTRTVTPASAAPSASTPFEVLGAFFLRFAGEEIQKFEKNFRPSAPCFRQRGSSFEQVASTSAHPAPRYAEIDVAPTARAALRTSFARRLSDRFTASRLGVGTAGEASAARCGNR
jgi:hypothetical protein